METMAEIPQDTLVIMINGLIELANSGSGVTGFQAASTLNSNTEDLLIDGAID